MHVATYAYPDDNFSPTENDIELLKHGQFSDTLSDPDNESFFFYIGEYDENLPYWKDAGFSYSFIEQLKKAYELNAEWLRITTWDS